MFEKANSENCDGISDQIQKWNQWTDNKEVGANVGKVLERDHFDKWNPIDTDKVRKSNLKANEGDGIIETPGQEPKLLDDRDNKQVSGRDYWD